MYILDYDRQLSMIREMTQLRKDLDSLVVYYHHPSTNEMWKSYFPKANSHHRGPKILRTEPVTGTIDERLDECLTSDAEENAMGLGIELSINPGKWDDIIAYLEEHYRSYDRRQLRQFLDHLGVEKPAELFNELGLKPEDYDVDMEHFNNLAHRSKLIRFKRFWTF